MRPPSLCITTLLLCQFCIITRAKPHDKERPFDKELSDIEHGDGDSHDARYDHEAFLGKEESQRFDTLTSDESIKKLSLLVDKMDADKNGKVSEAELKDWIHLSSKRYLIDDRDRSWKELSLRDGDMLIWDVYHTSVISSPDDEDDDESLSEIIEKDKKRWEVADENHDGVLDKNEYLDFLHPEDAPRMRDVVINETMVDLDTNRDGFIDEKEYIHDMWHGEASETEPQWVVTERETFKTKRDKDGDGHLDRSEVDEWILPKDFDHVESETNHLISSADEDGDGELTKEEILSKHEVFVGSQATDFGEALGRHDEL